MCLPHFEPEDQDDISGSCVNGCGYALRCWPNLSPDDRTAMLEELPATVTAAAHGAVEPGGFGGIAPVAGLPRGECRPIDDAGLPASCARSGPASRRWRMFANTGATPRFLIIFYVTDAGGKLVDIVRMRRLDHD